MIADQDPSLLGCLSWSSIFSPIQQQWCFAYVIKKGPRIHSGFVGSLKVSLPCIKPPPNHGFRNIVPALLHPLRHPGDGINTKS
jgi:hypothetical protein